MNIHKKGTCFSIRFEYDAFPDGRLHLTPLSTKQHSDCSWPLLTSPDGGKPDRLFAGALIMPPFTYPLLIGG